MNRPWGGGFGRGAGSGFRQGYGNRGGGFGWRNIFRSTGLPGWMRSGWFFGHQPTADSGTEKQFLENQVEVLKSELDRVQNRLNDLESTASEKE
jgi:hypothetical protein